MVKIRAFRYRSALLLCLTLLTGCPGRGDYYRFDETVAVSTRGDNVCFSVPEPEDYQPVSVSIAREPDSGIGKLHLNPRFVS
ncbi:hypothetical protein ECZC10_53780 [Escherichia coli]|nr:hypothetical protein ECZC10_53780 [Escherichia coli]